MQYFRVGHVHFMLFIPFFSVLGTRRECFSQWNMGFIVLRLSFNVQTLASGPPKYKVRCQNFLPVTTNLSQQFTQNLKRIS